MKKGKNIFKRFLSGFLSFVIVLAMIPFTSLTIVAAENDNLPVLDYMDEYNAKSSTAIKNISNMMNASSNSAQYSALLKRAGGYAALLGGSIDAIRGAVYSYDSNDEWYENIWNIGSGAVAGFLGLSSSTSSNPPIQYDLAEMKSMIQDMDQDIQEINSKLDTLEEDIQTNFEDLKNAIINKIQETEHKQALDDFTGDFKYYLDFKPELSKKYNALLIALDGGDEKNIKQAYDDLYIAAEKSKDLYGYITGENKALTGKQTIQDILYDYSVLSSKENFELTCVEFAEDLNSTYIFAQYCLSLCYNYQLLYAQMNKQSYDAYYYVQLNNTEIKSIQYASISSDIEGMLKDQNTVNRFIAKYMCKVLRLNGEFDYMSRDIRFGTVPYNEISANNIYGSVAHTSSSGSTVYYRTNNNVQRGDVIQICEMPDAYLSMFNPLGFDISVSNSNATMSNGIVRVVGSSGSFDIIYSYDGMECYRVSFNIIQKYSGGLGTENAPYLISTPSDFNAIRSAEAKCYYLLINDINYSGSQIPLINISNGGFGGVLDGGGYKVYNYQITSYGINNNQFNNSLFPIVRRDAIIKNLTIGDLNCQTYNGYSVQYQYSFGPGGYSLTVYNGILSGINEGTISNCNIQNVKVDARIEMPQNASYFWSLDAYVGGFAADNRGTISHSVITNSNLTGRYKSNQAPCRLYIGGISGTNRNLIANCFSIGNNILAETTAASYTMSTQSLIYGGNIIGQNNGSNRNLFGENCSITMNPYGTHEKRAIYGIQTSSMPSTGTAAAMESQGWMDRGDGKAIIDHNLIKVMCDFVHPNKTVYYVGETLNLTGMELYYSNTIRTDLLGTSNKVKAYNFKVSGFDSNVIGKQTVTLTYNDISTSFDITVLCSHTWENGTETSNPSHTEYGVYTEICSICGETKETLIDKSSQHEFSSWTYYNPEKHQRICVCGETVYADHTWNGGTFTIEPTHVASGERTYTCTECAATKTEEIPPIEGHTFGEWTKHDDTQHVHACECGETEYKDHIWDDGTITTPATYEQEGVKTYACLDCEATYTVAIPKPVSVHLFVVDDASAVPGGTMQVNVRLENNPGIAMMRLKISYDSAVLTLNQVTYNTEIGGTATQPTISDGYVTLLWYNDSENVEGDWIFATLSFTVKETATIGSVSDIILTYDAEEVCDIEENNVVFSIDNGSATVLDHVPGDINGDDGLTSKDLLRLARYFAGWDVDVNENALDINGDGNVNSKDLLRLARYLAGWDVDIY